MVRNYTKNDTIKCIFENCEYIGIEDNLLQHIRKFHKYGTLKNRAIAKAKFNPRFPNNYNCDYENCRYSGNAINLHRHLKRSHKGFMTNVNAVNEIKLRKHSKSKDINIHKCNYKNCKFRTNNKIVMLKHYELHNAIWCEENGIIEKLLYY
jgi:hypothetical protein